MGLSAAQLCRAAPAPPDPHPAPAGTSEHDKLCRARDQCRDILKYVNEAVKQAENRHRLEGYQKRLDATSLERTSNPLAAEFKVIPAPGGQGGAAWCQHTHHCPLTPTEPRPHLPAHDPRRATHLACQQGQDCGYGPPLKSCRMWATSSPGGILRTL